MKRFAIFAALALCLGGCVPSSINLHRPNDHAPGPHEREFAFWRCTGQSKFAEEPVPIEVLIQCTKAIYGGRS